MRLLVVSQYFWPENFRINDLVVELVRRGHTVTVLTGWPNYPDGAVFKEFRDEPNRFRAWNGVEVVRVPLIARGRGRARLFLNYLSFALTASILGWWRLRARQFDAIFGYEPSPATVGIPAIVLRAIKRAPLAFWVLDLWPETLQAVGVVRSGAILGAIGKLVAVIYARCDLILAQSRSFIPAIAKYCSPGKRIAYFPSWAEAVIGVTDVQPAPEVPLVADSFDIMFTGNIGEAQDFPSILAAAELLRGDKRIRWILVGDGRKASWVKEQIRLRRLEGCVLMLGRYSTDRMASFYLHADALLVCLKDEPIFAMTIPGKLQSYLTAGVPIVAMLNGEGAQVVECSKSGVTCKAGDPQGLAAAVLRLAALTHEERSEMGRNALAVSSKEFDRSRLISELEALLEELVEGSARG